MKKIVVIGAGPAGCTLANWCHDAGFDVTVLERADENQIYARDKAGLFKASSFRILDELGLASCAPAKKMVTMTRFISPAGESITVPLAELTETQGRPVCPQTIFNQNLINRLRQKKVVMRFATEVMAIKQEKNPSVVLANGETIEADIVVGCDGNRGATRAALRLESERHDLAYKWLVMTANPLAGVDGVIYGVGGNKFACHSPRTATESRYYLQIDQDDTIDEWDDKKCSIELKNRLGVNDSLRLTAKREMLLHYRTPLQLGDRSVMLAGDAAHIVAPLGGQGMNMALEDIYALSKLFTFYLASDIEADELVPMYEKMRLSKIRLSISFSRKLLAMTHEGDGYALQALADDRTAATQFAHSYVGTEDVIEAL